MDSAAIPVSRRRGDETALEPGIAGGVDDVDVGVGGEHVLGLGHGPLENVAAVAVGHHLSPGHGLERLGKAVAAQELDLGRGDHQPELGLAAQGTDGPAGDELTELARGVELRHADVRDHGRMLKRRIEGDHRDVLGVGLVENAAERPGFDRIDDDGIRIAGDAVLDQGHLAAGVRLPIEDGQLDTELVDSPPAALDAGLEIGHLQAEGDKADGRIVGLGPDLVLTGQPGGNGAGRRPLEASCPSSILRVGRLRVGRWH